MKATFTGRNFGWLPGEQSQAIRHLAQIIRDDDGRGQLASEFGGYSYRQIFQSAESTVAEMYVLPEEYRIEIALAKDAEIVDAVARAVEAYIDSLIFSRDNNWDYDGSPYDAFLEKNKLPRKPDSGQSAVYYSRHLLSLLNEIASPRFITPADNCFKTLKQDFRFGSEELAGLKLFFTLAGAQTNAPAAAGRTGNCIACHLPPSFTDFGFHNTGATQEEYDAIHGAGKFAALAIPDLAERDAHSDACLPPTAQHPRALGIFLEAPAADKPGRTDLGLWNVFANPDHPSPQAALRNLLDGESKSASLSVLLPRTIALFKTPGLRGLGFSAPYLHNGKMDTVEEVIQFYRKTSALARAGQLRNAAPELLGVKLAEEDVAPLAAFLRALNEDYE